MNQKQVNEAFVNHTRVKYGESKVYVIGVNELNGTATIKMAAHPDLQAIEVEYSELEGDTSENQHEG